MFLSGDIDKLVELLLDGYDHIIDIADEDNIPIVEAVSNAQQAETVAFLQSILAFEVFLRFFLQISIITFLFILRKNANVFITQFDKTLWKKLKKCWRTKTTLVAEDYWPSAKTVMADAHCTSLFYVSKRKSLII